MGLLPDGIDGGASAKGPFNSGAPPSGQVAAAVRTMNFWLILLGSTLVLGAMNSVIQHLILFLRDQGYSAGAASRFLSILLISSLGGRVLVGYLADRFSKKNTMALFYLLLGAAIPLLYLAHYPVVALTFVVAFGFSMGADYMLIPLVTAECFGVAVARKALGPDHYGIHHRSVARSLDGWKDLRSIPQLWVDLGSADCGLRARSRRDLPVCRRKPRHRRSTESQDFRIR